MRQHRSPCTDGFYYTVKCGDTLQSIADQHGVTVKQIIQANSFLKCHPVLIAGQPLCIPDIEEE